MRVAAVINPQELLSWWEGRGGRQPLSLRQIAHKLGVSESTTRKHLQTLRAAGQVNDAARAQALTRRPLPRGGRPGNPLDDEALHSEWKAHRSLSTIATNLHVSRSRVRTRLRELGLLEQAKPGQ